MSQFGLFIKMAPTYVPTLLMKKVRGGMCFIKKQENNFRH